MKILYKILTSIASVLIVILYIGGGLLHCLTTYILFLSYGFWAGFIGFCLPIVSTLVLGVLTIIGSGFWNFFIIILLSYIGGWAVLFIFGLIASYIEDKLKIKGE